MQKPKEAFISAVKEILVIFVVASPMVWAFQEIQEKIMDISHIKKFILLVFLWFGINRLANIVMGRKYEGEE